MATAEVKMAHVGPDQAHWPAKLNCPTRVNRGFQANLGGGRQCGGCGPAALRRGRQAPLWLLHVAEASDHGWRRILGMEGLSGRAPSLVHGVRFCCSTPEPF